MDLGFDETVLVIGDFARRLHAHRDTLDRLNVFPIADNDTGSNMVRTLDSIVSALAVSTDLEHAADRVEDAALDGRGNSGLIIGQFLAGFCSVQSHGRVAIDLGLAEGARRARAAVAAPVEGTMLTVADAASASFAQHQSLEVLLDDVDQAVRATPTQLAVLAERDVVDSGAAGLQLFFEALDAVVGKGTPLAANRAPEELIVCNVGLEAPAIAEAYEVQFRVPASIIGVAELQHFLGTLGTDVVVGASADQLAAHLHVDDPHRAAAAISAVLETRPGAKAISYDIEPLTERAVGQGETV